MEDEELIKLRDLKAKLLERTNDLFEKLKNYDGDHRKYLSPDKLASNITTDIIGTENTLHKHEKHRFCKVTRKVTGVKFENIDRKWMDNNIFKYTAELVTSVINIFLELTVKIEREKEFEIQNITCHFVELDNCYMLEIQSWIQDIIWKKNLSLLISAISQYSEICKVRKTILEQLKERKYITWEQSAGKNGGITALIHSPENKKQHHVYLQFQWTLIFLEKSWQARHFFDIQPTPEGMDFAEKNQALLRNFCKKNIPTKELIDLFFKMCNVIDLYENNNDNDSHEDTNG